MKGEITPVFFGSALTNFGIEPFFDSFVDLAPSPKAYMALLKETKGEINNPPQIEINPTSDSFAAYVFKIQANMNPKHRDSMAFLRICSGSFERDMDIYHHRLKREVRLSRSYAMVSKSRVYCRYSLCWRYYRCN